MITFILKLIIIVYLFYMIKYVHEMLQYNPKASLLMIDIPMKGKIHNELIHKSPLLINYTRNDLTIETMNYRIPGYIINDGKKLISFDEVIKYDSFIVQKNSKLVIDYLLEKRYSDIMKLFSDYMTCGQSNYLSLYRGDHISPLTKNKNETLLLQPIQGSIIIYLFNPKHEKDIIGLQLKSIKKWSIKLELNEDNLLYIPPEWSYFYEVKNDVILSHIECDSYPSVLFNYLRKINIKY